MASSPKKENETSARAESDINELLDPFLSVFGFESANEEGFPIMDVFENTDYLYIEAELPGIDRSRVTISIVEGALVIEGEKSGDRIEGEKGRYICIERSFGKFRRSIEIPRAADTSRITAKYSDGVLLVTIPKLKEQRKRTRKVEIE